MRVVFLIEHGTLRKLEAALTRAGLSAFVRGGEIQLWPYESRRMPVNGYVYSWPLTTPGDVFIRSKGVYPPELSAHESGCTVLTEDIALLINQQTVLKRLMRDLGLDREMAVMREIAKWHDQSLSITTVRSWAAQFTNIGRPDVGHMLLQAIRVVAPPELKALLAVQDVARDPTHVVAVLSDIDESGGSIAHMVRDDIGRDIVTLKEALTRTAGASDTIHVLEDGLWSGMQVARAFERICNGVSREAIRRPAILLRFGLRTDLGEQSVRSYLASCDLPNVTIANSGERIEVLTPTALAAFSDGTLNHTSVKSAVIRAEHLKPIAFTAIGPMDVPAIKEGARGLLADLGSQLWRHWLGDRALHANWTHEAVATCALGVNGIGSTIFFSHSPPTAALPVYWASGDVTINGHRMSWTPLFRRGGHA